MPDELRDRSWCHPSFLPVLETIRERGAYSPHAYVEYECQDGTRHTHQVILGDGKGYNTIADGETFEDVAQQLQEAVENCEKKDRIDQHGDSHWARHSVDEARNAYFAALHQLATVEYDREAAHLTWLVRMYKKWGGHIPGAVFVPSEDDPSKTELMVPDANGDPHFYRLRPGTLDLPDPRELKAIKLPGFGWRADRRRKGMRLLHIGRN